MSHRSEILIFTWRGSHPATVYLRGEKIGSFDVDCMAVTFCMRMNLLAKIPTDDIAAFAAEWRAAHPDDEVTQPAAEAT